MMDWTEAEKAVLRDLRQNTTWLGILQKLGEHTREPRGYKSDDNSEKKKVNRWIYESGIERGRTDVLKLLSDG